MIMEKTIIAWIAELIDTHKNKCDGDMMQNEDAIPHIISEEDNSTAKIKTLAFSGNILYMILDDGSRFDIQVNHFKN